jgi:hypothetical protein
LHLKQSRVSKSFLLLHSWSICVGTLARKGDKKKRIRRRALRQNVLHVLETDLNESRHRKGCDCCESVHFNCCCDCRFRLCRSSRRRRSEANCIRLLSGRPILQSLSLSLSCSAFDTFASVSFRSLKRATKRRSTTTTTSSSLQPSLDSVGKREGGESEAAVFFAHSIRSAVASNLAANTARSCGSAIALLNEPTTRSLDSFTFVVGQATGTQPPTTLFFWSFRSRTNSKPLFFFFALRTHRTNLASVQSSRRANQTNLVTTPLSARPNRSTERFDSISLFERDSFAQRTRK